MTTVSSLTYPADKVKFKIKRYHNKSEPWQTFYDKFDKKHNRKEYFYNYSWLDRKIRLEPESEEEEDEPKLDVYTGMRVPKTKLVTPKTAPAITASKNVTFSDRQLVSSCHFRQIPKYSGFVPRFPLIKSNSKMLIRHPSTTCNDNAHKFTTSSQAAYGNFPNNFPKAEFLKKTNISSLVTLVPPNNPFRLDKEESQKRKDWNHWNIKKEKWMVFDDPGLFPARRFGHESQGLNANNSLDGSSRPLTQESSSTYY